MPKAIYYLGLYCYLAAFLSDHGVHCNTTYPGGEVNTWDKKFVQRLSALIPLGQMARKDVPCSNEIP